MNIKSRLFKELESEKINKEIMNKVYPVDAFEEYFLYGVASMLSHLEDTANIYIDGGNADKLDAYDLKKLINENAVGNEKLKEFFYRLRKDSKK